MIIKLSEEEMRALEATVRNLNGNINTNHLMKVVMNEDDNGKKSFELKIRKAYTEPVLKIISRYSGFIVPMVNSGIEMLKSMGADIEAVENELVKADNAEKDASETRKPINIKTE